MPFIWDDSKWLLVGDHEPYDKSRFVVARKLIVKLNTDPDYTMHIKEFSTDQIRRHIEKFGEIESIEILAKNGPAHVTFVSDRCAYLVVLQHEYDKEKKINQPFQIEPIDSWEQPKENKDTQSEDDMEVDEQPSEISILNEDCLLHLFKFLDVNSLVNMADVCKLFNRLLHQHCFPRIRKYKINCEDYPIVTLAKVRRALLCIGQHLTDLSFKADYEYNEDDEENYKTRLSSKFLRIIAQNVGQNIRRASFKLQFDKDNYIAMIAPILRHLESLKIDDKPRSEVHDFDFHALCPNLIELKVGMRIPMVACCKSWPTLRSLSVDRNYELNANTLISFIEQNPQLTCLEFDVPGQNHDHIISAIANHLSGLEKLAIYSLFDEPHSILTQLKDLSHLCEIQLEGMDVSNLKGVIDQLSLFTNLRKIQLYCDCLMDVEVEDYRRPLLNLTKYLPNLEELKLDYVPINEKILVDLVSSAQQLKSLYVLYRGLIVSDELIDKLVEVLKCSRHESDEALQLYLNKCDLDKLDAAKNLKFERYLQLNLFKF